MNQESSLRVSCFERTKLHTERCVIADTDPQSLLQMAWMPDQVRHDNCVVRHDKDTP